MKKVSTKKALITSILAMALSIVMLVGATYAVFTDSATTGVNDIQAGTLDIALVDAEGATLEGKTLTFKNTDGKTLWEPDRSFSTDPVYVKNDGDLPLQYTVTVNGLEGDAELLAVIDWTVTVDGVEKDIDEFSETLDAKDGTNDNSAIVITGTMSHDAGNEYMGKTATGFSITVTATQASDAE